MLTRQSRDWIYSLDGEQQVSLKCRQNSTWTTSTWSLQGNGVLHNASVCHITGQIFQLYPATEGHSVSTVTYSTDLLAQHIEPITHQELQLLQGLSPPDVSKLDSIAATSELFKHPDLDATPVLHATNQNIDNRYCLHWYIAIPTLPSILLIIALCNGYPYLSRNLLRKIRCITQPVPRSTPDEGTHSLTESTPETQPSTSHAPPKCSPRNPEFVTYSVQPVA
jgi:hypothetical protein